MAGISIGELARRAAIKVPTIRYYEQIGLLRPPSRTEGRQRRYDDDAVARLNFIRHARELGFEIADVRELLGLAEQPDRSCADVDEIARRHVHAIDDRIARLASLRRELQRALDTCQQGKVGECRVIEALASES
ncbi:MAG TPA: helix-turn-helix domain-containing protein [Rhodoblastus sp.]|nr:helix-turn-helix domain-containing protein [Rhodoblastus sp.]